MLIKQKFLTFYDFVVDEENEKAVEFYLDPLKHA